MIKRTAQPLALLVFTLVASDAAGQVTRTEAREGSERVIILENQNLKVVVFPDLGGRIGHLVDKADGKELVYWDLSRTAIYHGEGGALDDRRNTFEPYEILKPGAGQPVHAVRLAFRKAEILTDKTISLSESGRTIRIDYVYRNRGQQDLGGYEIMTKNWFFPSGVPITNRDVYLVPTSRGVRRIRCYDGRWNSYPELRGKFKQDVGPWTGIASTSDHRAIGAAFSNDFFRWFYFWKNRIDVPTYEWVFGDLPAGNEAAITLWLHVVHGVDGLSYANRYLAADLQFTDEKLHATVFAADGIRDGRIETETRRLPETVWHRQEALSLGPIAAGDSARVQSPWKPAEQGTYVVRQKVLDGPIVLGEYEEVLLHGKPSGEYARPNLFPARASLSQVRGWRKEAVAEVIRPDKQDITRGYLLYVDSFGTEKTRGRRLSRYELAMGQGELKSVQFKLRALRPLKRVAVKLHPGDWAGARAELFGVTKKDMSDKSAGKQGKWGRKLVPWETTDVKAGEDREIWVRLDTNSGDEGRKRCKIEVQPEGARPAEIDLIADVRPVALPSPNLVSLEVEHSTMILPGCWNRDEKRWNREVVERYTRDLGEHLTDFEQGFWGWFRGPRDNLQLVLGTTGQPIRDYLESKPDLDPAPVIDFSYLNPVFDAAIRHGMVRFSTNCSGNCPPKGLAAWVMREAAQYLRDRGYPNEDIWCKDRDEQPSTEYGKMAKEVQWLRQNGYRPYSTFHNILAVREFLKALNPAFDLYQGGFTTLSDARVRAAEGVIDQTDELWMYQGWGATWLTYEQNRRPGWFAAAAGLNGYHVHVYYRWNPLDAIIFPSEQGPSDSPAWEGMRDGMADAQYVALARRWIARLEKRGKDQPALVPIANSASAKLAAIVGGPQALVRLERKRDRLTWVERMPELPITVLEEAHTRLLDLLMELKPQVEKLGPSLYDGNRPLVEDGRTLTALAPGADPKGKLFLRKLLSERFGLELPEAQPGDRRRILDFRVGTVPPAWAGSHLHLTSRYPPAGEYLIHRERAVEGRSARTFIFGRDPAGLEKGIRMWACFLRKERRQGGFQGK